MYVVSVYVHECVYEYVVVTCDNMCAHYVYAVIMG